MADDLVISGGGTVEVSSTDLVDRARHVEHARNEASVLCLGLPVIDAIVPELLLRSAGAPASAYEVTREIHAASSILAECVGEATLISAGLRASSITYGLAERATSLAINALAGSLAHDLGGLVLVRLLAFGSPLAVLGVVASPIGAGALGALAGASIEEGSIAGGAEKLVSTAQRWLATHNEVLTNAGTVELIRLITGSMDDAMNGFVGLPAALSTVVGGEGLGLTGTDTAAAVIVALTAPLGLFGEHGVTVERTSTASLDSAPATFEERLRRIPQADENGGSQVRIDRFSAPGRPDRFEAYISGTQTFAPAGTDTPFDLGSNVRGVAGMPNGSLIAVEKALADAGVTSTSPVVFTGHSQGGLLAHELAASGKYNTVGVLEAGPPASQTKLPPGVHEVILAHDSDIVTALGGPYPGDDAVIVGRDPFGGGTIPTGDAVPAHSRHLYAETAELLDRSSNPMTGSIRDAMNTTGSGATTMTTMLYKAARRSR